MAASLRGQRRGIQSCADPLVWERLAQQRAVAMTAAPCAEQQGGGHGQQQRHGKDEQEPVVSREFHHYSAGGLAKDNMK